MLLQLIFTFDSEISRIYIFSEFVAVSLDSSHVKNTYSVSTSTSAPSSQSAKSNVFSSKLVIASITHSRGSHQIRATFTVKDSVMSSTVIQHISTTDAREKTTITAQPTIEEHETGTYTFLFWDRSLYTGGRLL